jgi:hypothetical protein
MIAITFWGCLRLDGLENCSGSSRSSRCGRVKMLEWRSDVLEDKVNVN